MRASVRCCDVVLTFCLVSALIVTLVESAIGQVSSQSAGLKPQDSAQKILHAAHDGDMEKIKSLLKDNPDLVFSKDNLNAAPLHYAALNGHADAVQLLLGLGADVNAVAKNDYTALHFAAQQGYKDVAEVLLANKAQIDPPNKNGMTPLALAAAFGRTGVAEVLLAHHANVNAKDGHASTPLHYAAIRGSKDIVEVLLANKADIEAKDAAGRTPLQMAVSRGHADVASLLRQHGGAEQMVEYLADLSALLQQSSLFLIRGDVITNPTVKIGVDMNTGMETIETVESDPSLGTRYQFMADSLGRIELDTGPAGSSVHTVFQQGADGQVHASSEAKRTVTIRFLADVTVRDPVRGISNGKTKVLTLNTLDGTDDRLQQLQAITSKINGLINAQGAAAK